MPQELENCVQHLLDKGYDKDSAYPICRVSLNLSQGKSKEEIYSMATGYAEDMKSGKMKIDDLNRMPGAMDPDLMSIEGVDIFQSGEWNGDKYNEKDLDQIVEAFNETKDLLKPYLKIGHADDQKILRDDELPSAGWISNIYRSGKKILADFVDMPRKIYELIKRKAYNRVSAEIFVNIPINGKKYPLALKAVALLGGETPAVHTLDDIMNLYGVSHKAKAFETNAIVRRHDFNADLLENKTREDKNMEEVEKLKEFNQKLTDENTSLKGKVESLEKDLAKEKEFSAKVDQERQTLKTEKKSIEIDAKIAKYIQDKKILPAQAPALKSLLLDNGIESKKFSVAGKEFNGMEAVIEAFVEAGKSDNLKTEDESEKGKNINSDLDSDVKSYMAKNNVSYKEALLKVASEKAK